MGGGFAGEVSSVKLLERGVDVVGVEQGAGGEPVVDVDLNSAEDLGAGLPGFKAMD
jgi:anaerobic glycerol-3-phosphate dehydrogenase